MYGLAEQKTERPIHGPVVGSKALRLEKILLLLWFVINLGIGAATVRAYGMSIDEPNNYRYAADTLKSYPSLFGLLYKPPYNSSFDGHGPAFVAVTSLFIKLIQVVFPNVFTPDLWHYSYFITFELTGLCIYALTKRWFSRWTAWAILILFGTQPLLLGHAFMNPKDIPFMFLLTLSIVAGFRMVDHIEAKEVFVSLEKQADDLSRGFQAVDSRRKRRFLFYVIPLLVLAFSLFLFSRPINTLIEQGVKFFYQAQPDSWTGQIFNSVASHSSSVSMEDYAVKALRLFRRVKRLILFASLLFSIAYFYLLIRNLSLQKVLQDTWDQRGKDSFLVRNGARTLQNSLGSDPFKNWFKEFFQALRSPSVLLAGLTLGLAAAVRAVAPFAGLIVVLYLLAKVRSRTWTTALAYFFIAGIVTYIAWPRLWDSPIRRYSEGLGIISHFPYPGRVLFAGQLYGASNLPRSYLPVLLSIQLTEPLVLCIYLGLGLLVWRLLRGHVRTDLLLYMGIGFGFPLLGLILLNSPLYHNFRQALFLIPAMVMLAAPPLEMAIKALAQNWARILVIIAIALPGVISTLKLYPYEYVYYNSFVGGLAGARDRYELDYWRISLREMALQMNKIAPTGSKIVVTRSAGLFVRYSRPDLVVDKVLNSILDLNKGYDYIVQVNRWQRSDLYPDVDNMIVIQREGTVLATAKDVKQASVR